MKENGINDKAKIIQQVIDFARETISATNLENIESFIQQCCLRISQEDLEERDPHDIYAAILCNWHFAAQRKPGEANVRVFNPQYEQQGWQSTHTVVSILTDEIPFLVESVRMELIKHGLGIHHTFHPTIQVTRDAKGSLIQIVPRSAGDSAGNREQLIHIEVDRQTDPRVLNDIRSSILQVLADIEAAVMDWSSMRERMQSLIEELKNIQVPLPAAELTEELAFLEWAADNHFTFLGYRNYQLDPGKDAAELKPVAESALGISRVHPEDDPSQSFVALPHVLGRDSHDSQLLILTKAGALARVHRPVPMDYIGVKAFDAQGNLTGEHRFLGLYTAAAYFHTLNDIPLLRRKVEYVIQRSDLKTGGYSGRALANILETYPRDELLQVGQEELFEICVGILNLQERKRTRLFMRQDIFGRFFSCLVFVPRDHYDTALRLRIEKILKMSLGGDSIEFNTRFSDSILARIHFTVRNTDGGGDHDVEAIGKLLAAASRTWEDHLCDALIEHFGEEQGNQLIRKFKSGFPAGYREHYLPWTAVFDIEHIIQLSGGIGMSLYRPLEESQGRLNFKLFHQSTPLPLSDVLPVLENMGLRVIEEHPFKVVETNKEVVWIHDFAMQPAMQEELDPGALRANFQEAFKGIWQGELENDGFNRLVINARLSGREVSLLRACCKYLLQMGVPFSQAYMQQTLVGNPEIARLLVRLFQSRFKPHEKGSAESRIKKLEGLFQEALDAVLNLDQDRILQHFYNFMHAVLRTNYYQEQDNGSPRDFLSFKLDPVRLPSMPLPRPKYEIFVYSPRMEGVHLRGGKVARGGIRWSDRREDFRTEILGLMKAQMVKNSVIVPEGAKGGFVVKNSLVEGEPEGMAKEVRACYQLFIQGLLGITDNILDGAVSPPANTVRYDDDDPYLVVAADKGTATFSDTANAIATEHGFWLGDAFASGGSVGYDHRLMAITSRGAWESVKRHFREMGRDIQSADFTVAGIGDMAGDVFGNGMLRSPHIRLVAAFNHMHIFLDPDPDPTTSFKERTRMFSLQRSTWASYDRNLISNGGGIFLRSAKSIPISDEVRKLLEIEAHRLPPADLIHAILQARVDLLWVGGIGTYVKSSQETHAEAGDKANDTLRVDGRELRCKVVGEGGNLGFTQLGRIEFAQSGGRINTDFIDNSAGVDCSDREVNIKILLNEAVADGDLTVKQRNRLLMDMTDEVAEQVLQDNYRQSQALSLMEYTAVERFNDYARLIGFFEKYDVLDRELEDLPSDETLHERQAKGLSLTRVELSVLLSYAKIYTYQQLLASDVPEDKSLGLELERYFPLPVQKKFRDRMPGHRLQREIITNQLTNIVVNRMGATFVHQMGEKTGSDAASIVKAFAWARHIFKMPMLWKAIEALDNKVSTQVQMDMMTHSKWLVERVCQWLLRRYRTPWEMGDMAQRFTTDMDSIKALLPKVLMKEDRRNFRRQVGLLTKKGVPKELAQQLAGMPALVSAPDIVEVAASSGNNVERVARLYFMLGEELRLSWLRDRIADLPRKNYWQTRARAALRDEFYHQVRVLTARSLNQIDKSKGPTAQLRGWREKHAPMLKHWNHLITEMKSAGKQDHEMLSVVIQELRDIVGESEVTS